jgi:hypothetical protein
MQAELELDVALELELELEQGLILGQQREAWKLNGTMDEMGWVGLPY